MKSLKTIIIAGVILLAFIVASIVVINLPQSSDEEETSEEETTTTTSSTVYVINTNSEDLDRFVIVPTEREVDEDTEYSYASERLDVSVTRTETESGGVIYTYDASPDPGKFEYDTSKFRSMLYTLTSITATNLVEEDAQDLTIYGLDQPTATIETYYADGTEIDLIIGSLAPVDGSYYCMTSESNTVYTIGSYVDSLLVRRPIEYRDITLFPTYTDDDIYSNIDWVRLTERDGSCVEFQLDSNLENEYNTENSLYVMLQPYAGSGNDTTIESYVMDVVSTLTLGSIIDDITEDQYADYGLNNPAKLEMTDISGNSISLLVGNTCPNDEYTYCMIEGTDTLLTCNTSAMDWMGVSYVTYMLRTIWTYSSERLQSIEINMDGDEYELLVDHYVKQNANGNDTDGVTGTLNGQEISETNTRRLYVKCLYFRIMGNLTDEEKEEYSNAEPYGSITINLDEDESHTLEIIRMTDRKYALRLDGETEYYCYKKNITSLMTSIGYVLAGDELDMSFD
jgi:hypothetical protein